MGTDRRRAGALADRPDRNQQRVPARMAEFEVLPARDCAERFPHHRHVGSVDAGDEWPGAWRMRPRTRDGRKDAARKVQRQAGGQVGAGPGDA